MKIKIFIAIAIGAILFLLHGTADAARNFTFTQTNPLPASAVFTMGDTAPVTFRIANTNGGGNNGERIYKVKFDADGATTFSASTAAPAGWTRIAYSATSVTFQANSWADAIAVGSPEDFQVQLLGSSNNNANNEDLNKATVYYSAVYPFSEVANKNQKNKGGWAWRALVTSLQITDLTGAPIATLAAGSSFRLVMTVQNRSKATQNGIVSNPTPPSPFKTGTVTQGLTSTVYSPNPLNLGTIGTGTDTGTITFTYSTAVSDNGTIYFTAFVQNGAGNATSKTVPSPILTVTTNRFIANISVNPICAYNGQNITVAMSLTNGFGNDIVSVTPTLNPSVGAPVVCPPNPTPAAPNGPVLANNAGTYTFQWVCLVTGGTIGQTFTFSGSATGTQQPPGVVRTTPPTISPTSSVGGYVPVITPFPVQPNASSANVELMWTITNQGCANVNSVSISIPVEWTLSAGDNYSLVNDSLENTWNVAGTNPVVFTAPSLAEQLLTVQPGEFCLVFSSTPTAPMTSTFNIDVTDANGITATLPTTITVNPYDAGPGGGNYTGTGEWQEVVY